MCDIIFDNEINVEANTSITIMVRFIGSNEEDFCGTFLGYNEEDYSSIDNHEKDPFLIKNSDDCTKGETDENFGQIPRILYFNI